MRPYVKPSVRESRYKTEPFYGLNLTYRFSYLSGKGKRVLLHVGVSEMRTPEKKLFKRAITKYVDRTKEPPVDSLKKLPPVVMRQVCDYLLSEMRTMYRHTDYYPLGFLLEAHANEIVSRPTKRGRETSDSTKADKEAAIRKLQEEEGNTRWGDVTPEHCRTWLSSCSVHRQNQCAAVMRALHEIEKSISNETIGNPAWAEFDQIVFTQEFKMEVYRRKYLRMKQLNDAQIAAVLEYLCKREGNPTLTGLAVLMLMTIAITPEELCALTHRDIRQANDYTNRYSVIVKSHRVKEKGKKNYTTVINDSDSVRCLPLPYAVGKYYERCVGKLKTRIEKNGVRLDYKDLPVFTAQSSLTTSSRPDVLKKKISSLVKKIIGKDIENQPDFSDGRGQTANPVSMLKATARSKLLQSGLDEDAIRYSCGLVPKSMAARYYIDPASEAEQCRIGCIIDRWLAATGTGAEVLAPANVPDGGQVVKGGRGRTGMRITLQINPVPENELKSMPDTIIIGAKHGLSGVAVAEKGVKQP